MRPPDWQTEDGSIRLFCGDCLDILPELEPPPKIVQRSLLDGGDK